MRGKFVQALAVVVVAFLLFRFGVRPPMPLSLLSLYMAITLLAVLLYVSADSDSWRAFLRPLRALFVDPRRRPVRLALGVALPLLVGYYTWSQATAKPGAPFELRAVHPAPPDSITFRGKTINLQDFDTPVRREIAQHPERREQHLRAGAAVYIRNCVYCHGDNLDGGGHFAHGFNPVPANFTDPGTIAQLSEGYLFWRIAKGGPGLPKESTPWNSAMPAWEDRLSELEIWQVIYYLYEATGYPPRRMEGLGGHARGPEPGLLDHVAGALAPRPARAQPAGGDRGRQLYQQKCAGCHGDEGKGDGPAAELLVPRPRDFTSGKFKIRSTASGQLPTDEDLARVIRLGMPGTSMPGWGHVLREDDIRTLVAYVKGFYPGFKDARPEVVKLPPEVKPDARSVARGKEMFEAIECWKCHGRAGRGDPEPGSDLKDDWGQPIRPANLTKPWTFRGGASRQDVALRLATGLAGTPMPTFADSVERPEDLWHLANYVRSLGPDRPQWATVLTVLPVSGDVPSDPGAAFWDRIPPVHFPLVGQVIVDPRNFHPTVDMLTVRAVHTSAEIVFHLTWDDPTPSDPRQGAPRPDRIAVQLPARGVSERPYFLMGDAARPVYLLTWEAGAGVGEAVAEGPGRIVAQSGEALQARGEAAYEAGRYRVVIRRPLRTPEARDFEFSVGTFFPVAFWAWDGSAGEEGPRAAVSAWYYGRLEGPPSPRPFVIPPLAVLGTVLLELGIVRWARSRGAGPSGESP